MSSRVNENSATFVVLNHGPVVEAEVIPGDKKKNFIQTHFFSKYFFARVPFSRLMLVYSYSRYSYDLVW